MGSSDCCRFMHFFTPILGGENIGVNAKLRRKEQSHPWVD